jgi:hypothetical protein
MDPMVPTLVTDLLTVTIATMPVMELTPTNLTVVTVFRPTVTRTPTPPDISDY